MRVHAPNVETERRPRGMPRRARHGCAPKRTRVRPRLTTSQAAPEPSDRFPRLRCHRRRARGSGILCAVRIPRRRLRSSGPLLLGVALLAGSCGSKSASVGANYTRLIIPVPDVSVPYPLQPPGSGRVEVSASPGQVYTIGDILLCAVGQPGTVRIGAITPQHSTSPLVVAGFATRKNPYLDEPPGVPFGVNVGSLEANGFPSTGAVVTACAPGYKHVLPAHLEPTTELGISFEMRGSTRGEDDGLVLTYQSSDRSLHTLTVPTEVELCPGPADAAGCSGNARA